MERGFEDWKAAVRERFALRIFELAISMETRRAITYTFGRVELLFPASRFNKRPLRSHFLLPERLFVRIFYPQNFMRLPQNEYLVNSLVEKN